MKTDSVMRRLAAANPYPDGATATSDELFAQIITQPAPARSSRKGYPGRSSSRLPRSSRSPSSRQLHSRSRSGSAATS